MFLTNPAAGANVGATPIKSEASVAVLNQGLKRIDDPVDAVGDLTAAFLERRDAAPRRLEAGLELIALALERLETVLELPPACRRRGRRLSGGQSPVLTFAVPAEPYDVLRPRSKPPPKSRGAIPKQVKHKLSDGPAQQTTPPLFSPHFQIPDISADRDEASIDSAGAAQT